MRGSTVLLITAIASIFPPVAANPVLNAAQEMSCCSQAAGSCRNVCSKISLVVLGAETEARGNATQRLLEFCSLELVNFWSCVNSTFNDLKRNENWLGRGCCHLAQNPTCRTTCALSGSRSDLAQYCRPSDEPEFFFCLEKREDAERCCSNVSNDTCRSICKDLFYKTGKQSSLKLYSSMGCFHQVPKCLKSVADVKHAEDPKQHLHCCDEASTPLCLDTCRKILHTATTDQEIMDALTESCSPVFPQLPMWSCLLKSDSSKPARLPLDAGKLACCTKAVSSSCQNLCWRAFQADWESAWPQLDATCLSSSLEGELRRCLEDADDPCEMGCSGLSYCARFNDRPTTLFRYDAPNRQGDLVASTQPETQTALLHQVWFHQVAIESRARRRRDLGAGFHSHLCRDITTVRYYFLSRTCTTTADEAAKWEADHWSQGGIIRGLGVPVRAAASCPAETLRTAACLLQLRPCESRIHETRLCREDCLELMASCVDWSAIDGPHTAATLCAKLSPGRPDAPCVSLGPFLRSPQDVDDDGNVLESAMLPEEDITTPCKPNPCSPGHLCMLQPNSVKVYRCLPACSLGEMSKQLVPVGTWIQVPRFDQHGCLNVCQCTNRGLEKCRVLNCFNFKSCWVHDRFIAHKASFYLECNPCHCFEGEFTCSKRNCGEPRAPSLPCDCSAHYVPVCSRLGVTFASACLAKCAELSATDVEFGSCSSRDPCASNPCGSAEKCVRRPRVCLSRLHKPCRQYECAPMDCNPRDESSGPVCDQEDRQYPSVCAMIRAGSSLSYRGPCLRGCSLRGPVCGVNGEMYANECAAWAERVVVDYQGPCVAVGLIGDAMKPRCGDIVQCPPLAEPYCIGVTPPGACCPVCGGAARLIYSKKQLDRIYYMMDEEADKDSVTLEVLLTALARQLRVAQCAVRGMLTPDLDVFIIVQPVTKKPSALQLRACVTETEKLVTRISERSSRIAAEIPLGSLTRAEVAHNYVSSAMTIRGWLATVAVTSVVLVLNVLS
ncbi:reversion-inducing cysteine-rich protein with Kazal motifs isoform X3 [Harpegnathos saltator]|uniref:reversion-inducing cysteine-rich protein with Kazal motifs isoform X3 n=1 Tax=Harpegnathos saltator TaxID=610380 RepID=UPI000948EBDE|nr:reversion-inducing cysteine-rich protein with Kazal motifs isoform X3 [Harpegnathos saltator]